MSERFHPKEKSDQGATDLTPKRNMSGKKGNNRKSKPLQNCSSPTATTILTVLGPDGFAASKKPLGMSKKNETIGIYDGVYLSFFPFAESFRASTTLLLSETKGKRMPP